MNTARSIAKNAGVTTARDFDKCECEKVTLYVPCYNAEKYISECLDGILKQTYPLDEILIIDDGSTDKTVEIVSNYPVRVIRHGTNKGLAAARNTGFKNACGEYVASLDADCVPEPDWLEKLMKNFTEENIAGVGGKLIEKYTNTLANKWRAVHMRQNMGDEKIINSGYLFGSNNVFERRAVEEIGYYNEKYRTNYEDVDLSNRLKEKGYTLIYDPEAEVYHLLKDTISSLLDRSWRWGHADRTSLSKKELFKKVVIALGVSALQAIDDVKSGHYSLIPLDFLAGLYNAMKVLKMLIK